MARRSRLLIVVVTAFTWLVVLAIGQERTAPPWKPGGYKGLETGVSTSHDVLLKLGKPKLRSIPEGPNSPSLRKWHFEQHETVGVCCDLLFRSGVLQEITLDLGEVEQAEAAEVFGGTFTRTHFRADSSRGEGGSAPLCEDPDGDVLLLLDPERGLYLWVEPDGKVSSATFASTRPGVGKCRQ